jgi:hypothetical protein
VSSVIRPLSRPCASGLVDVDVVCPEGAEAGLEVAAQGRRAAVPNSQAIVVAEATLGGDDDRLARRLDLGPKRLPEELLRSAEPVGMRRVEEVDPETEGLAGSSDGGISVDATPVAAGRPVAECNP